MALVAALRWYARSKLAYVLTCVPLFFLTMYEFSRFVHWAGSKGPLVAAEILVPIMVTAYLVVRFFERRGYDFTE